MGSGYTAIPTFDMAKNHIDIGLKNFLKYIFCVVGHNSPYALQEFLYILITAALSGDFVNNTSKKVQPAPNGQTVFNRLIECTQESIGGVFNTMMVSIIKRLKITLRNRKVVLAFDTTYEPFYGDLNANNFWIHEYKPVRGCIGCFIFITMSIVVGEKKFILGSLPVPIQWNKADYVEKLIRLARRYIIIDACLFDRGFNSYELVHRLKKLRVGYQIFWKKDKKRETWLTKELKKLKPRQMKEYIKENGYFLKNKSKHYVRTRFIIIKQYKYKDDEKAFDWVFATNRKLKSQMWYIRGYKCRWGIETTYRITGGIRIKTTTLNEVKRYFLFVFSCLLYNLWKFANLLLEVKVTFQTFVFVLFNMIAEKVKKNKEPPDRIKQLRVIIKENFV